MPDAGPSSVWSTAVGEHVARTTQRAARNFDLYYLLLRQVAQRGVEAQSLADATSRALEAHGPDYVAQLTRLHARFFSEVVRLVTGAGDPPPAYDASDPGRWFHDLMAFAATAQATRVRTLTIEVAHPLADKPTPLGDSSSLAEAGQALWQLVGGAADAGAAFEEALLRDLLQRTHARQPETATLQLSAPHGVTASTWLTLENARDRRAILRCAIGDVRRPDGVGPAFVPDVSVEPPGLALDPGQEGTVRLSIVIDTALYEPDVPYLGAVQVVDGDRTPTVVPLCITSRPRAETAVVNPR